MSNLPHNNFYYANSLYQPVRHNNYEGFDNYNNNYADSNTSYYQDYNNEHFSSQPEDAFVMFYQVFVDQYSP